MSQPPTQPSQPWPSFVVAPERAKKGRCIPRPGPFCLGLGEEEGEEVPAGNRAVSQVGGASKPRVQFRAL